MLILVTSEQIWSQLLPQLLPNCSGANLVIEMAESQERYTVCVVTGVRIDGAAGACEGNWGKVISRVAIRKLLGAFNRSSSWINAHS